MMADPTSLSKITEEVVRHRFSEAAMLVRAAERVMSEVRVVAGSANGVASAAEARVGDARTLVSQIDEHIKTFYPRPKVEGIEQRVDECLAIAVKVASEGGSP